MTVSGSMDVASAAGKEMSAKRKAENHLRTANMQRIMKRGESRADSERDSGFSGSSEVFAQPDVFRL